MKLYGKAYRLAQTATSDVRQSGTLRAAVLDGYLHSLILSAGDPTAGGDSWRPERLDELFREAGKHVDTDWAAVAFCRMAEARKKLGDDAEAGRLCRQAVDKAWSNDRLAMEILLRVRRLLGPEDVSRYCRGRLAANPDSLAANATMFHRPAVERGLAILDQNQGEIWAKLEAGTESYFRRVDRTPIPFSQILRNITAAARIRPLVIQALFLRLEGRPPPPAELEAFCERLNEIQRAGGRLRLVQVYTVARRPAENYVAPLADDEVDALAELVVRRTGIDAQSFYGVVN